MRHCQCFRGVSNQISCHEGVFHTDMSHGDSVTDRDCGNHNRSAARHGNAHLDRFCNLIQIHVPRYNFIVGADHADERSFQFLLRHAQRIEQGAVGCLLNSFFHCITSHK